MRLSKPPASNTGKGEKPVEAAPPISTRKPTKGATTKASTGKAGRPARKPSKNKGGRPTKYKPEYCEAIVAFFSKDPTTLKEVTSITKKGITTHKVEVPEKLPLLSAFARSIDVDEDTLLNWTKEHPEFFGAYTRAKALQKEFLIHNGLAGLYDTKFAMFVAVNCTDMRDKVDHTIGNPDGTPLGNILDRVCNHTKGIPSERSN